MRAHHFFLLAILLFSVSFSSCTKAIEKDELVERGSQYYEVNSEKPFTGYIEEYYPEKEDGTRQIKKRRYCEDGWEKYIWKSWYEDGTMEEDVDRSDNGHSYSWFENGQKRASYEYQDGKWHGQYSSWHENGQIFHRVEYVKGQKQGMSSYWDSDGNIFEEAMYKDGLLSGEYFEYYPYRKIKAQGEYQDSVRVGTWKIYHESGELMGEGFYDPELSGWGEWTMYSESGNKTAEGRMKDDKKEGLWTIWEDGDTTSYETGLFSGNERDSVWNVFQSGVLREVISYDYGDGKRNGDYIRYDENGKLEMQGILRDGNRSRMWKFYENGILSESKFYVNARVDGIYESYYPDGKIKDRGQYEAGEKNGWWSSYNKYGRKTSETLYSMGTYISTIFSN